ncbi:uncharacterized protein LOC144994348 [Oryzias latipes]
MTWAEDEEEFPACGSRREPQGDVGTKPEQLSWFWHLWRSVKGFLKDLQPKPENSRTNEKSCSSLESSYDSQRSDQSSRLRPNFSADCEPPSTKNQLQGLEEEYLDFEWEEDDDDFRNQNLHHRT